MLKTTKQKLLDSALKLFNENWFENTSTTSICKDAGFSSWALFVHFKTKNELLDYLYVEIKKNYFVYVLLDLDTKVKPEQKFRTIIKRSFDYYIDNYEGYCFIKNFASSIHISRIAREKTEFEMKVLFLIHEEGRKKWVFIDEDFEFVWLAISWMFYSLVKYVRKNKKNWIEKSIDLIMKIVLK